MKTFRPHILIILGLWVALLGLRAAAADFELSLTASPEPVVVGDTFTYTIGVTNRSGLQLSNVVVSDFPPASALFLDASNSFGAVSNDLGVISFYVELFPDNTAVFMTLTVRPTVAGAITNFVVVTATNATQVATTSVASTVFAAQADLGVTLTVPPAQILTNDWITYTLTVTNRGPGSVASVTVSNLLPAGVGVISVIPTNQAFTNNSLIFNLASLANGSFAQYQITVQPTNAGVLTFSAAVSAPGLLDTNAVNDAASTNINVATGVSGGLTVSIVSTQRFNPQTGLMEQTVRITNGGTNAIASARVVVSGLTNWLFNAVGTNSGQPFVIYGGTLAIGESVDLLLKYFVPSKSVVANPSLSALEVPLFYPPVPSGTPVRISRLLILPSGNVLIEFPSALGRSYTVLYYQNGSFSNTYVVQPKIVAPADRVQWIDDGPPATISAPRRTGARFYRVVEN